MLIPGQGITVLIIFYVAVGIKHDRSGLAGSGSRIARAVGIIVLVILVAQELTVVLIVVSINALPLETVDTAEGVTDLRAFEDAFVVVIEVQVLTGKHRSIHVGDGVNVLCDVTAQFNVELAELEDRLGADKKFPTLVLKGTYIGGSQGTVTGAGRDTHAIVEQVGGCLFINVQVELEQVLKEVQLNADVPRLSLFPLNLRKAQVLRNDYLRAIVKRAIAGKLIIDKSFCIGRVTRDLSLIHI